ncbi:hypothetical protein Tco_1056659 [Tanacetum coccineum]|uniref:Retrovirus-related Pol polyprotein from transposon TNT 1-94-like beta-barrel domain-containing protein n=1 Tax=Tanacetum coccineum TaxID=301880 RepID=A0ABQ5H4Z2_9ASTR
MLRSNQQFSWDIIIPFEDNGTSQSKQISQSSSKTFIYKTLIIPSFLDSCFISSTVSEDKRAMLSRTSWRDIGYEKRIWQSLHKYFKKLYKPTNNNLRTSSNSRNKTEDTTPRKPKRVKDYAYHKEKMMMCKQAEQGVPLQAEQADWLEDTDEEIDEQELEAHYSYMAKIQEVSPAESSLLITPLETGKTKKVFKAIKESEASLTQELKECKTNLDESSRLGGATSSRDSSLIALQTKQTGCLRRVIHSTSISRPQLKCYQVKEKVMPNISQVKFTKKEVEDHHRISSISKKTKSVTACNDSFKTPIVQLILFIVDSGCTKHMTGNLKLLCNFVEKFLGTVRFGNDQFAPILGLGR